MKNLTHRCAKNGRLKKPLIHGEGDDKTARVPRWASQITDIPISVPGALKMTQQNTYAVGETWLANDVACRTRGTMFSRQRCGVGGIMARKAYITIELLPVL